MILSIASGKGGTGKTTIATNLALSLEEPLQFLDCDVEEPNGHLFLSPNMSSSETVSTFVPEVDMDACNQCRKCVEICHFNAIAAAGKNILVFPELCHSCRGCIVVCPTEAISESQRELGQIRTGTFFSKEFHSGHLRIGEAMAPPLIKKVRSFERPDKLTIIDAPPGTSCPVIMAMRKSDFVLLVTEPTPFGLHDLQLAVEAVKLLNIPAGLVINRADLGNDSVVNYAKAEEIPILMEVPFEKKIAEAYSKGIPIVEFSPKWREKFQLLYQDIRKLVSAERSVQ